MDMEGSRRRIDRRKLGRVARMKIPHFVDLQFVQDREVVVRDEEKNGSPRGSPPGVEGSPVHVRRK